MERLLSFSIIKEDNVPILFSLYRKPRKLLLQGTVATYASWGGGMVNPLYAFIAKRRSDLYIEPSNGITVHWNWEKA